VLALRHEPWRNCGRGYNVDAFANSPQLQVRSTLYRRVETFADQLQPLLRYRSTSVSSTYIAAGRGASAGWPPDGGLYIPRRSQAFGRSAGRFRAALYESFSRRRPVRRHGIAGDVLWQLSAIDVFSPCVIGFAFSRLHVLSFFTADAGLQDFGARLWLDVGLFCARRTEALTAVVATSGDTGTPCRMDPEAAGVRVVICIPQAHSEARKTFHDAGRNLRRLEGRLV